MENTPSPQGGLTPPISCLTVLNENAWSHINVGRAVIILCNINERRLAYEAMKKAQIFAPFLSSHKMQRWQIFRRPMSRLKKIVEVQCSCLRYNKINNHCMSFAAHLDDFHRINMSTLLMTQIFPVEIIL